MKAIRSSAFKLSLLVVAMCAAGAAYGARPPGAGGGGPPTGGEISSNNLSFPVIMSDNAAPAGFPLDGAWRFAEVSNPLSQCIGEEGVVSGPVPAEFVCYYGRHVTVVSETGELQFDEPTKVWWLQKRPLNFWKALSVGHNALTPMTVSAVDVGDLLESSPDIQARQIRVEFNLLQHVEQTDPEFGQYVGLSNCEVPLSTGESVGCFAALPMSGAVPGTEQSGNEIQGTDFGPGGSGDYPGSGQFWDPTTVRVATPKGGGANIPIHALVYSNCARLLIQKIPDSTSPMWDEATGTWSGVGVGSPVVNAAAYHGDWTTEITSSGSIVYGYNWNAKTAPVGLYRLTMVLDGNDASGPVCGSQLATRFEMPGPGVSGTQLVNVGEANMSATLVYAGDMQLGDEGGLAYIDVPLATKGGGKRK